MGRQSRIGPGWGPLSSSSFKRVVLVCAVMVLLALSTGCGRNAGVTSGDGVGDDGDHRTTTQPSTSVDSIDDRATPQDTAELVDPMSSTSSSPVEHVDAGDPGDPGDPVDRMNDIDPGSVQSSVPTTTSSPTSPAGSTAGKLVVIDPGHNGNNWKHTSEINRSVDAGGFSKSCNTTGTAAGNLTETAFNLAVAQRLEEQLSSRGIRVVLTRDNDNGWGPCIDERGQIAARANADLLVSIHADGSSPGNHGFHVISPSAVRGYTESTAGPSVVAATAVRDALVGDGFQPSTYIGTRGLIQRGDLGTLNRAEVPAIMIEAGNMKNASDLALLGSADGQRRFAAAIANGVEQFLRGR